MNLWRIWRAIPWRIGLLLALVPSIFMISLAVWFRWELQPLERCYLAAYWDSSVHEKEPGSTTSIQWVFKTAPGRKSQLVVPADVSSGAAANLPFTLSSSALDSGWTGLEKGSSELVNSAELKKPLKEYIYGNQDFKVLIAVPLLLGCAGLALLINLAIAMRSDLWDEWHWLYEEVSESKTISDFSRDVRAFVRRILSGMNQWNRAGILRLKRAYSAVISNPHSGIKTETVSEVHARNSGTVRQPELRTLQEGNSLPLDPPKKPPQRQSIFPGAAAAQAANAQTKPWDDSQWID